MGKAGRWICKKATWWPLFKNLNNLLNKVSYQLLPGVRVKRPWPLYWWGRQPETDGLTYQSILTVNWSVKFENTNGILTESHQIRKNILKPKAMTRIVTLKTWPPCRVETLVATDVWGRFLRCDKEVFISMIALYLMSGGEGGVGVSNLARSHVAASSISVQDTWLWLLISTSSLPRSKGTRVLTC
jgi:hypothetical protein